MRLLATWRTATLDYDKIEPRMLLAKEPERMYMLSKNSDIERSQIGSLETVEWPSYNSPALKID